MASSTQSSENVVTAGENTQIDSSVGKDAIRSYDFLFSLQGNVVNTLLTKAEDDVYQMRHPKRGVCVIINQKDFEPYLKLNERRGTDIDAENLKQTFEALSFEVHVHKNLSVDEVQQEICRWSQYDHSDCDAFVLCVLSHGLRDYIYHTDGRMATDKLFDQFTGDNCPSLLGKPKLFFIQACRGDSVDKGALARDQPDSANGNVYRLPAHADFLIAYATVAGFYAWRNETTGSWFIQSLCLVLRNENLLRKFDILTLMTLVNKNIAFDFQSNNPEEPAMDKRKQIPCIFYTLTRVLYLTPKSQSRGIQANAC